MDIPARAVPPALIEAVVVLCPGFTPTSVLHRSATSVLVAGEVWGEQVVAKMLTSAVPFWRETFAREIGTYHFFAEHLPPFATPRLIAAADELPLLVIGHLPGERLMATRFPDDEVPPRRLAALFTALGRLNGWRAPVGVRPPALDYRSRIDRYRRDGQFTDVEAADLSALLDSAGAARQFCHGDVVPTHVLRPPSGFEEGEYAFVDWAFAGTFLPGFDLAKIWTVLRATYGVRSEIEDRVRADGELAWHAFLVNLSLVVAQELRNQAGAGGERLAALEQDRRLVREHVSAAR